VYLPVIQLEEQHLRRLFPSYAKYAAEVPMLWPRLKAHANVSRAFRVALYLKNQEYQAAVGWIGGVLFLVWKALRSSGRG